MIGRLVDQLIGVISPATGAIRLPERERYERVQARIKERERERSQYAAAKNSLSTGGWMPVDAAVNTVIGNSASVLRSRARQLVRDMPQMATAVSRASDFLVGPGITMQARVKDPATGRLNKIVNQKIEDAWRWWCDEASADGRLHFCDIQGLVARGEIETGEFLLIKKLSRAPNRFLPLSLLICEPEVVAGGNALAGNELFHGVEYDPRTGRSLAYHFQDAECWQKTIRVPAAEILHGFHTLRPGQLRGVSLLAPALLLAHALRDYLDAEISAAQKAARWLAFVTSPDPVATMAAFGASASPNYTTPDGAQKYVMEFGHSIVDFLKTGEHVTVAESNRPGDNFAEFCKFIIRTFAATVGVTYELVSGDYYDAKYTAARLARNDMMAGLRVRRARLIRQLCEPVYRSFLDQAVITGKLNLPGYFTNPDMYRRVVWLDAGMESLDPMREGRAEADAVLNRLKSPQEILLGRGRDPEQVLDDQQEWQQMLDERGLLPAPMEPAPLKSNPAAVASQGKKKTGKQNGDASDDAQDDEE